MVSLKLLPNCLKFVLSLFLCVYTVVHPVPGMSIYCTKPWVWLHGQSLLLFKLYLLKKKKNIFIFFFSSV